MLIIERIPTGHLETNCYLVAERQGSDGVVIDPGADVDKILAVAEKHQVKIAKILNTHAHWDHVGADTGLSAATGARVYIHKEDVELLGDPMRNLSLVVAMDECRVEADGVFAHGEILDVGDLKIEVLHTPGHTPGSASFLVGDTLFSGDLLFYQSVGRTDLPGSDEAKLYESIHNKIMTLPDTVTIYPGHGDKTTVGWEREHNPFLSTIREVRDEG